MLDQLRHEVATWLAGVTACALASAGPAGVQASWVVCVADGLRLYLLLPAATDHLINLEHGCEVALAGEGWRMTGTGSVLGEGAGPWALACQPWQIIVEVVPVALHIDNGSVAAGRALPSNSVDFAPLHR